MKPPIPAPRSTREHAAVPCDWPGEERAAHAFEMDSGDPRERWSCTVNMPRCQGRAAIVKCQACGHGWCIDCIPEAPMKPTKEAPRRRWDRRTRSLPNWQWTGTAVEGGAVAEVLEGRNAGMFMASGWRARSQMQIIGTPYHRTEAAAKRAVERWLSSRRVTRKRGAR